MDETWIDERLTQLRAAHLETLQQWHSAMPAPLTPAMKLTDDQRTVMRRAMLAETAYDERRRELGLLP